MASEDAKPAKKEGVENDEDEKSIGSLRQSRNKKLNNASTTPNGAARVKKQEPKVKKGENNGDSEEPISRKRVNKPKKEQSEDEYEEPTMAKKSSIKTDKKKKIVKEEVNTKNGTKGAEQNGKKRGKTVYDLPGQKRDPPEERDPLRVFYESLYEQVPNSEMAAFWMMESGLLPKEMAKKVYENKLKKSQQQKLGSPMKTVVTVKKSAESTTVKRKIISSTAPKKKTPESKDAASKPTKKRKIEDDLSDNGSDDDFVLSSRKAKKPKAG